MTLRDIHSLAGLICYGSYSYFKTYLFICFWLCGVFFAVWAFLWLWQAGATLWLWCEGLSLQWLFLLQSTGSREPGLQYLWHMGLVVPLHVRFSWIRGRTQVSCIGRWILYHWATREVPGSYSGACPNYHASLFIYLKYHFEIHLYFKKINMFWRIMEILIIHKLA